MPCDSTPVAICSILAPFSELWNHSTIDPRSTTKTPKPVPTIAAFIPFSPGEPTRYKVLIDDLIGRDRYFLLADFADYVAAQQRVDALYAQPARWQAAVARNIAGMGGFSADRTIRDYVTRVWSAASLDSGTRHA